MEGIQVPHTWEGGSCLLTCEAVTFTQLFQSLADDIEILNGHELSPAWGSTLQAVDSLGGLLFSLYDRLSYRLRLQKLYLEREIFFLHVVLGLAGMELFLFQTALMVLRFRFGTKTVLTTRQYLSCCWAVLVQWHGLLGFPLCPSPLASGLGVSKGLGGGTARMADPSWPKGYSIP